MKEFYKIIGPIGEVNFVTLKRIVVVEFVEEEHLIVFDGILKIKISAKDYRCVRKDLLKELYGERTDFSYKSWIAVLRLHKHIRRAPIPQLSIAVCLT